MPLAVLCKFMDIVLKLLATVCFKAGLKGEKPKEKISSFTPTHSVRHVATLCKCSSLCDCSLQYAHGQWLIKVLIEIVFLNQ